MTIFQAMSEQAANNVAVAVEATENRADDNANDIPKHGHVDAAKKALKVFLSDTVKYSIRLEIVFIIICFYDD